MESKKDQFGIRKATQSGEMNIFIVALQAKGKKVTGDSLRKAIGDKYSKKRVDSHVTWMIQHGFVE
jgi:hypothetical protein